MKSIIDLSKITQVAVITKDVEATKRQYALFLGTEVPPTCDGGSFEITQCEYMGKPSPESNCKMAFFNLDNIQVEIIEPNGKPSTWQDFLDETGGGIHHIAFQVNDMKAAIKACEEFGMKLTQWGKYNDASGEYAYLDSKGQLGCYVELLYSYAK